MRELTVIIAARVVVKTHLTLNLSQAMSRTTTMKSRLAKMVSNKIRAMIELKVQSLAESMCSLCARQIKDHLMKSDGIFQSTQEIRWLACSSQMCDVSNHSFACDSKQGCVNKVDALTHSLFDKTRRQQLLVHLI